jgi:aryl-alcohol dehydrogenase
MKVRAAVLREYNSPLVLENLELAKPKAGEIMVRMVSASVCHTDVGARDGHGPPLPFPIVLGHEGAGVVEDIGLGVTRVKKGDHVVLSVVVHCNVCKNCLSGKPYACERFNDIAFSGNLPDGTKRLSKNGQGIGHFFAQSSFADYAVVPENIAIRVSEGVSLELLSPLSCGVQTGAGAAINSGIGPGSSVTVFGCGGVGLSAIMGARVIGATPIIGIDVVDSRLALARELGATDTINAGSSNSVDEVKKLTDGGTDYAIECVGRPETIIQATNCTREWGTVIIVGVPPRGTSVSFDFFALLTRTVRGCIAGFANSDDFIPLLVKLYQRGLFPFDKLSPRSYRLEDINNAVEDMIKGRIVKPLLKFT